MAVVKDKKVEQEVQEVKNQEAAPSFDQSAIMEMLASMQAQIASLKNENETLKSQKPTQSTTDELNQMVAIKSKYTGIGLTLFLDEKHSNYITLDEYGTTVRKRLVEVLDIVRLNKKFATLGYFIIEDMDIVEKYFSELIPMYEKTVDDKTFEEIGNLNETELSEVYKNANYIYQRAIVEKFIKEWAKGENANFMVHSKIQALTKASGTDIMTMINSVMERESTRKEFAK